MEEKFASNDAIAEANVQERLSRRPAQPQFRILTVEEMQAREASRKEAAEKAARDRALAHSLADAAQTEVDGIDLTKYIRLLRQGMDRELVEAAMERDGLDTELLRRAIAGARPSDSHDEKAE